MPGPPGLPDRAPAWRLARASEFQRGQAETGRGEQHHAPLTDLERRGQVFLGGPRRLCPLVPVEMGLGLALSGLFQDCPSRLVVGVVASAACSTLHHIAAAKLQGPRTSPDYPPLPLPKWLPAISKDARRVLARRSAREPAVPRTRRRSASRHFATARPRSSAWRPPRPRCRARCSALPRCAGRGAATARSAAVCRRRVPATPAS